MKISKFILAFFLLIIGMIIVLAIPLVDALTLKGIGGYPAHPDPANQLSKAWFIYNLKPGESKKDALIVVNNSAETKHVKLYPVDATTNNIGGFALKDAQEPRQKMGKWIKLSRSRVTLASGESLKVPFTITIPQKIDVGEHAGGIMIQEELSPEESPTHLPLRELR